MLNVGSCKSIVISLILHFWRTQTLSLYLIFRGNIAHCQTLPSLLFRLITL